MIVLGRRILQVKGMGCEIISSFCELECDNDGRKFWKVSSWFLGRINGLVNFQIVINFWYVFKLEKDIYMRRNSLVSGCFIFIELLFLNVLVFYIYCNFNVIFYLCGVIFVLYRIILWIVWFLVEVFLFKLVVKMYIKLIVLEGFKFYVQRIEVNGFDFFFNVIIGLNGSGKFNILDFICFLLGIFNLFQVKCKFFDLCEFKFGEF